MGSFVLYASERMLEIEKKERFYGSDTVKFYGSIVAAQRAWSAEGRSELRLAVAGICKYETEKE